jgi:PH/SEC7 domain-containing protein
LIGSLKVSVPGILTAIQRPYLGLQVCAQATRLISGIVHTVTAAMLMLNTDLHIADLVKHMSRSDFVRNAMSAIMESTINGESAPDSIRNETSRQVSLSTLNSRQKPMTQRSASAPVGQPLVTGENYSKSWELEAENALREIYAAVRSDRILLPTSDSTGSSNRQSMISLANSVDTKSRMRSPSDRVNVLKRGSVRMNNPYSFAGSDGRLSPTGSYANSINEVSDITSKLIQDHICIPRIRVQSLPHRDSGTGR